MQKPVLALPCGDDPWGVDVPGWSELGRAAGGLDADALHLLETGLRGAAAEKMLTDAVDFLSAPPPCF